LARVNQLDKEKDIHGEDALTPIHRRIHCGATPDTNENEELGLIAIDHFLDELADIALAIVRRREHPDQ